MASSFLSPPNRFTLSDQVISEVVQRAGPIRSRLGLTDDSETREVSRYTKPRQTFSFGHVDSYSSDVMDNLPPRNKVGRKRLPDLDPLADVAAKRKTSVTPLTTAQVDLSSTGRKMKVSASRRERCRINQARYRKRQRKYADDLDEGIRKVQEEIQDLEAQRQNILRCAPTNESVWVVATEFFRLFRYGYMAPMMAPESSTTPTATSFDASRRQQQSHAQLDFLKRTMTPDVTDGNVCGAEALLENWKLVSLFSGDVHIQLKRLEQIAADSLLALTKTSFTITENTLSQVFPHLVVAQDAEEGEEVTQKLLPLGMKLLNQRLNLSGSVRFDWDSSTGRVIRLESKIDLVTPMLDLLGSLEGVAQVFNKALVTLDGRFIANQKLEKLATKHEE